MASMGIGMREADRQAGGGQGPGELSGGLHAVGTSSSRGVSWRRNQGHDLQARRTKDQVDLWWWACGATESKRNGTAADSRQGLLLNQFACTRHHVGRLILPGVY